MHDWNLVDAGAEAWDERCASIYSSARMYCTILRICTPVRFREKENVCLLGTSKGTNLTKTTGKKLRMHWRGNPHAYKRNAITFQKESSIEEGMGRLPPVKMGPPNHTDQVDLACSRFPFSQILQLKLV